MGSNQESNHHGEPASAGESAHDVLLAKSGDRDYRSSDDDLTLGELDPLQDDRYESRPRRKRKRREKPGLGDPADATPFSGRSKAERRAGRWGKCIIILLSTVGSLVAIVLGGGAWVYKTAPKDGQSPPWYPTRKSTGHSTGSEAYGHVQRGGAPSRIGKMRTRRRRAWSSA